MEQRSFVTDYTSFDAGGAAWLVANRPDVQSIGIDYLTVATYDDLRTPHEVLLDKVQDHIPKSFTLITLELLRSSDQCKLSLGRADAARCLVRPGEALRCAHQVPDSWALKAFALCVQLLCSGCGMREDLIGRPGRPSGRAASCTPMCTAPKTSVPCCEDTRPLSSWQAVTGRQCS